MYTVYACDYTCTLFVVYIIQIQVHVMGHYCIVHQCSSSSEKVSSQGIKFHRLLKKNRVWLSNIRRHAPVNDESRVCSQHFIGGRRKGWNDIRKVQRTYSLRIGTLGGLNRYTKWHHSWSTKPLTHICPTRRYLDFPFTHTDSTAHPPTLRQQGLGFPESVASPTTDVTSSKSISHCYLRLLPQVCLPATEVSNVR